MELACFILLNPGKLWLEIAPYVHTEKDIFYKVLAWYWFFIEDWSELLLVAFYIFP